jgi:hypothetical protein
MSDRCACCRRDTRCHVSTRRRWSPPSTACRDTHMLAAGHSLRLGAGPTALEQRRCSPRGDPRRPAHSARPVVGHGADATLHCTREDIVSRPLRHVHRVRGAGRRSRPGPTSAARRAVLRLLGSPSRRRVRRRRSPVAREVSPAACDGPKAQVFRRKAGDRRRNWSGRRSWSHRNGAVAAPSCAWDLI